MQNSASLYNSGVILLIAPLGWLVGVLLNLLADDLPSRTANAADRLSRPFRFPTCEYCGTRHSVWLWSGLLAFLVRGGRCEHCSAPQRLRAPLAELGLALGFAYLWTRDPSPARFFPSILVLFLFLLIAVIDIEHRLILYIVSIPSAALMLLIGALFTDHGLARTLAGGAAGFGLMAGTYLLGIGFAWLVARLRGQRLDEVAFGWGDVMLGGVVGLLTGWPGVLLAVLIAVLAGGLIGGVIVLVQLVRRRYRVFTAMPYGPFLVSGGLVIFLWGKDLADWYLGG